MVLTTARQSRRARSVQTRKSPPCPPPTPSQHRVPRAPRSLPLRAHHHRPSPQHNLCCMHRMGGRAHGEYNGVYTGSRTGSPSPAHVDAMSACMHGCVRASTTAACVCKHRPHAQPGYWPPPRRRPHQARMDLGSTQPRACRGKARRKSDYPKSDYQKTGRGRERSWSRLGMLRLLLQLGL